LHKYLYAGDDPMNMCDPSGCDELTCTVVGLGIAAVLLATLIPAEVGVQKHIDLQLTEGTAYRYYFPDISTALRKVVAQIAPMWNDPSQAYKRSDARERLTDPLKAWDAWDILELTNHSSLEQYVGDDSVPQVPPDEPDMRMVIVDGQTFHDYTANYVAFGEMMRISGHKRSEIEPAVDWAKFGNGSFELDQSGALAWALAGFDGMGRIPLQRQKAIQSAPGLAEKRGDWTS
jgi:hypothetical protein